MSRVFVGERDDGRILWFECLGSYRDSFDALFHTKTLDFLI